MAKIVINYKTDIKVIKFSFYLQLKLPHGCVKACVLIENVLASFEMHEILYALKDHSLGLNCGIWDYSASFINKFGKVYKMYNQQAHFS